MKAPRAPVSAAVPFGPEPLLVAGLIGAIAFVIYALTTEPGVPTGDSGDLISSAYVLGVPHPPGYPLYMLLGHLAMLFPGGSPAFRMNLLSGIFDAVAVSVVFLVVYRLVAYRVDGARVVASRFAPYVAGASAALLLAFSTLFWAYSVVAEVFALNNLFAALLFLIGLEWCRRPERVRLLWLWMFVFGLALCDQQTIALLVPGFAVLLWQGLRSSRGRRFPLSWRDLGLAVVAFAGGLLPFLYLPRAALGSPAMNWGDPDSLSRFIADVDRQNYGSFSLVVGSKQGSVLENLKLIFGDLTHGFVYVGAALAVAGLWWAWRNRRPEGLALLVSFLAAGPVFMALTNTAYSDELTKGIVARFYILPSIPFAIVAGLGAWWLLERVEAVRLPAIRPQLVAVTAAAALLAAPVASAVVHYSADDQNGNYVDQTYGEDLLSTLAPHAVLLMRGDENETSVGYVQNVLHYRTDVVALDTELLKIPSYVSQQLQRHPDLAVPWPSYDGGVHTSLNTLVRANLPLHPVYVIGAQEEKDFGRPFESVDAGLARQLVAKGSEPNTYSLLLADPARYAALRYPTHRYPSSTWEGAAIEPTYGEAAFALAYALSLYGTRAQVPLVERMYRIAIRLEPTSAQAYKNLGLMLHAHGGSPLEIVSLWTTYLRLDPKDPQAGAIQTVLNTLKSKLEAEVARPRRRSQVSGHPSASRRTRARARVSGPPRRGAPHGSCRDRPRPAAVPRRSRRWPRRRTSPG